MTGVRVGDLIDTNPTELWKMKVTCIQDGDNEFDLSAF